MLPCLRYRVYTMPSPKQSAVMKATMRDFRAAPAKLLRRAARTGAKVRLGEFLLVVREAREDTPSSKLYGAMSTMGRLVGPASGLLTADEVWSSDES